MVKFVILSFFLFAAVAAHWGGFGGGKGHHGEDLFRNLTTDQRQQLRTILCNGQNETKGTFKSQMDAFLTNLGSVGQVLFKT